MHELEGYERLILEAMLGDQALFTRSDGIERLWEVATPLLDNPPPVELYTPGSWGPTSITKLIRPHHWYLPGRQVVARTAMTAPPIRLLLADVDGTMVTPDKVLTDRAVAGRAVARATPASCSRSRAAARRAACRC